MIVKGTRGGSFGGLAGYLLREREEAEIIASNSRSDDYSEIAAEFRAVAQLNDRVKKPVQHIIVSWTHRDTVSNATMGQVAESVLEGIGVDLDNHQYVAVRHDDTRQPHMHIMLNRVGMDGAAWYGEFWGARSRQIADELEAEYDFEPAIPFPERHPDMAEPDFFYDDHFKPSHGLKKYEKRTGEKAVKRAMHDQIQLAMDASKGKWVDFEQELSKRHIAWTPNIGSTGNFHGSSFTLLDENNQPVTHTNKDGETATWTFKGSSMSLKGCYMENRMERLRHLNAEGMTGTYDPYAEAERAIKTELMGIQQRAKQTGKPIPVGRMPGRGRLRNRGRYGRSKSSFLSRILGWRDRSVLPKDLKSEAKRSPFYKEKNRPKDDRPDFPKDDGPDFTFFPSFRQRM